MEAGARLLEIQCWFLDLWGENSGVSLSYSDTNLVPMCKVPNHVLYGEECECTRSCIRERGRGKEQTDRWGTLHR